jgi:hypothetical protein
MRRDYDVFEKFSDGSTLWRACVRGKYEAKRKLHELAEHSENDFFLIDHPGLRPRAVHARKPFTENVQPEGTVHGT